MPDQNPKTTCLSNLHQFRSPSPVPSPSPQSRKPTKPNTKVSGRERRSCRRCPDGEDGVGEAPRPPIELLTPNHTRSDQNQQERPTNSCRRRLDKTSRPVTRERLPVDGQGRRSSRRHPPTDRESLAWGRRRSPSGTTSPPAPAATARNRRQKNIVG